MKLTKSSKKFIKYYILGFSMLLWYYLAEFVGLVPHVFEWNLVLMLPALTFWYGTGLFIVDKILNKIMRV